MSATIMMQNLGDLDAKSLKEMRNRIDFLLNHNTNSSRFTHSASIENQWWRTIILASKEMGINLPPYSKLTGKEKATVQEYLENFESYIATYLKGCKYQQKVAFYKLSAELILEHLQYALVPITTRSVISCIPKIPSLVERAFPGYAKAGVLHMIIK